MTELKINEMKARELRTINPTADMLLETVDYLWSIGWRFQVDNTASHKPAYSWGWWTLDGHSAKCKAVGNPGNFHFKAWDTLKTYVAQ